MKGIIKNILIYAISFSTCVLAAQVSDFKHIDFTQADNRAGLHEGKSLDNLPLLTFLLTDRLQTDVEKFRAIYLWVCMNIRADPNQNRIVEKQQEKFKNDSLGFIIWNNHFKKVAFKKLLKHQKTMCTGYAYLIKEMCFIANIECKIVDGYARTITSNVTALESLNHSWNAVKLNNTWYLCDATWSSGYMINDITFVKDFNEGYFLTEPILFAKNHYPQNKKWLLNDSLKTQKFIAGPMVYDSTFKHNIVPIAPNQLNSIIVKNQEVNFKFKSIGMTVIEDISLIQKLGKGDRVFKIYDINRNNNGISFKYRFDHCGNYDVHLKIKDDIVASYNFRVIKP